MKSRAHLTVGVDAHIEAGETGAVLPFVLLVVAALSIMAAAGFLMAGLANESAESHQLGVRAFHIAEAGLEELLGSTRGAPPPTSGFAQADGTASLRSEQLLALPYFERIFRVESTGISSSPRFGLARRTVGALLHVSDPPRFGAALLAAHELDGAGATGTISGTDRGAACPGGRHPGVVAGLTAATGVSAGSGIVLSGAPPRATTSSPVRPRRLSGLDWEALLGSFGPLALGSALPGWPVVGLPPAPVLGAGGSGRGTVIARGDLILDPGFAWRGAILVGGRLIVRGSIRIRGAVAVGLDSATRADTTVLGPGPINLVFDACAADSASASVAVPPAVRPGSWFERF